MATAGYNFTISVSATSQAERIAKSHLLMGRLTEREIS